MFHRKSRKSGLLGGAGHGNKIFHPMLKLITRSFGNNHFGTLSRDCNIGGGRLGPSILFRDYPIQDFGKSEVGHPFDFIFENLGPH